MPRMITGLKRGGGFAQGEEHGVKE